MLPGESFCPYCGEFLQAGTGFADPRFAASSYPSPTYSGPRSTAPFAAPPPPFVRPLPFGQTAYLTDAHGRIVFPAAGGYPGTPYPGIAYPAAAYSPPYITPLRRTNGLAIASLVLGLLWIWWLGSVLAVVFGHAALHQTRRRGESGSGLAIAGLVLGWLGLAALGFVVGLGIASP